MNERRAVIVGAGIGGPVLALWLQKIGVEAVLAEARPSAALGEGAFLGVAPNGMNVLDSLGLAQKVLAMGHTCTGFQFNNARGQNIGVIDRSADQAMFRWPLTMVRRADLHALLAEEATKRGISLRYGLELKDVNDTEAGVRATFSDGTSLDGEFLVGCDGLRSTTRALAVPKAPAPVFSGLLDFGGFTRVEGLPFPAGINQMVFGRRAFFGAFTTPTGETWWFHNGPPGDGDHRTRMLELHRDDPAWVRQLIESTPSLLGPWGIHDLHAMPQWTNGRICLLGDAAHAMSPSAGQGASLAMEDAMVLAQCVRDVPDVRAAFVRFEKLRRPRVDAIFKEAQRQSSRKAPTPLSEWFRDRMLPFFLKFGAKAQTRSYAYRIEWDQRVTS